MLAQELSCILCLSELILSLNHNQHVSPERRGHPPHWCVRLLHRPRLDRRHEARVQRLEEVPVQRRLQRGRGPRFDAHHRLDGRAARAGYLNKTGRALQRVDDGVGLLDGARAALLGRRGSSLRAHVRQRIVGLRGARG